MTKKKERHIQLARRLLQWNQKHLNRDSTLSEALIGECFAEHFVVEPNGRRHEADRKAYKNFLDGMKSTMTSIQYEITHTVADEESVVLSMNVEIQKIDTTIEHFAAILLIKFDEHEKVRLWHEVYVQQG